MNRFVEAKLIDYKTIQVLIFNPNKDVDYIFTLVVDNDVRFKLNGKIVSKKENSSLYEFKLDHPLTLGYDYRITITDFGIYPLNVNNITNDKNFDNDYFYNGNDLGAIYTKKATSFALWAPLASTVILWLDDKIAYNMDRHDKGVYRVKVDGDLKGHFYNYYVTNCGVTSRVLDPYGKASTPNGDSNVILDFKELQMNMYDSKLYKLKNNLDAIIYEGSVRDLTSDPTTNIKEKGKFLGLIEEGRVNKDQIPVGFDYLTSLGFTHLQLLPIYDFKTTDELHPEDSYNWGYDPAQYFVPEGSYASNVKDPKSRIVDLLKLVSKFHSKGIRIVMDVVYNHVYEHQHSTFELIVPNYYFRRFKDGRYFNASGCGNDFACERKMAKKFIIDACKWWVSYYHIDGFRFDLMGLLTTDTINDIKKEVKKINPNFIMYGEGWNMFSGYDLSLANHNNYSKVPDVAFFNDYFRDVVIGNLGAREVGFGLDNIVYRESFKEAFTGSSFNFNKSSRFNNVTYSLNFVECHDNETLYDKINYLRKYDKESDKLKRVNFINGLTMLSFGIPFFHAGQEIGLSKNGNSNSYNAGDKINSFKYSLLKQRMFMVENFRNLAKIRKNIQMLHETDMDKISKNCEVYDIDNGGLLFVFNTYLYKEREKKKFKIFINPSTLGLIYNNENKLITISPIMIKFEVEKL